MDELSTEELRALAESFGVGLPDAQVEAVRENVNAFLEPLDEVDGIPVDRADGLGDRTWRDPDPGSDPYNAVVHRCDVPHADPDGDLAGLSVGLKDIVAVAGVPMECGSDAMRGFVPRTDAAVTRRLRRAGARITAKLTCDEFAGSARGTTGADGPVRNPNDPGHTAGGSSGGSAVAVATGEVDAAIGTDTGGSVRIPAAFCGVVGVKPTHGLVPLSGVVENTYTQDHVGPLAPDVATCARVLDAIAGKDPEDPASMVAAGHESYRVGGYAAAVADRPDAGDLTLALVEEGVGDGVSDAVAERTEAALGAVADAGGTVRRVSVDGFDRAPTVKNLLSLHELAAHWRAGGAPYRRGGVVDTGFQAALASRTGTGGRDLSAYYRSKLLAGAHLLDRGGRRYTRAQAAREALAASFADALGDADALVLPTMPDVAPRLDDADDPGFAYGRNTRPADVTRQPAVTVPNGTVDGLPVGVQLMGPAFGEADLLGAAAAVEPLLAT
jgi:amidase/aspartyl-tRNA(Asn)/glutamyl-tRNA(Gln) amidotransferase subunit A